MRAVFQRHSAFNLLPLIIHSISRKVKMTPDRDSPLAHPPTGDSKAGPSLSGWFRNPRSRTPGAAGNPPVNDVAIFTNPPICEKRIW